MKIAEKCCATETRSSFLEKACLSLDLMVTVVLGVTPLREEKFGQGGSAL